MKALIENTLRFPENNPTIRIIKQFERICNAITTAENESELRANLNSLEIDCFVYGFGGSHLWVNQRDYATETIFEERIMICEFN